MSYDLVITGGNVVDGTGDSAFQADIGIRDGKIQSIGKNLPAESSQVIDASGKIVTPGFVDIHTHYDGQATWDGLLEPSSGHGVTTVVMGNCGVGFAPVRPGQEEWLIQLMEGVEDIPGTALSEGIEWTWESFPEYLDTLDMKEYAIDIGSQVAHGAIRSYVMGDRGSNNEPATKTDIAHMKKLVHEAIDAGALGVSTSRVLGHRAMNGEPVPGTFAAEDELYGLGEALQDAGQGVFELAPAGADGQDLVNAPKEMEWMKKLSATIQRPVTFALLQNETEPHLWKQLLEESLEAANQGSQCFPQVAGRPFGLLIGLQTHHAFAKRPSFINLSHLPHDELVHQLKQNSVRDAILNETDNAPDPNILFDGMSRMIQSMLHRLYPMGEIPDYEPNPNKSFVSLAEARNTTAEAVLFDYMLENNGHAMGMMPIFNYVDGNHDVIREMLLHPQAVSGLSDGGAHCGMICDASIPTFMLSHWTRDRTRGEKLPLEWIIKKQTNDTASLYGLDDRGTLQIGKRADINVIDYDALTLYGPKMAYDLPAGGRRLLQEASGYDYTVVAGTVTRQFGKDTGQRPGRLIRGAR
ncbi:MAG: amidohydrolase [Acidimicrobiaceae bacterium]|nr:amidohydrolase [Acidimicrobiaceae bacterium]|tara:strand:+ start:5187 stop:6929 length:1743 start_codon:yes stop_codon:yes gene_type:complete